MDDDAHAGELVRDRLLDSAPDLADIVYAEATTASGMAIATRDRGDRHALTLWFGASCANPAPRPSPIGQRSLRRSPGRGIVRTYVFVGVVDAPEIGRASARARDHRGSRRLPAVTGSVGQPAGFGVERGPPKV
jgi:hypothetical protein